MEVTQGEDDLVRSAKIRKPDGKVQEQSINHLYYLELSITHSHQEVIPPDENSVSDILAPSHPQKSTRGMHKKDKNFVLILMNLLFCFCKNKFLSLFFISLFRRVLELVNSAINVCSKMIGCFEVVPLSPASTVI